MAVATEQRQLTRAEIVDRMARHYLSISGAEFLARWDAGEFAESADRPEVIRIAMLLPDARKQEARNGS